MTLHIKRILKIVCFIIYMTEDMSFYHLKIEPSLINVRIHIHIHVHIFNEKRTSYNGSFG